VDEVAAFYGAVHGKDPAWLQERLSIVDASASGYVLFAGTSIQQKDETTCGSMSIVVARAMSDPMYAFMLTADSGADPNGDHFADRLAAEEQRTHDATNTVWPQALGTTPWGIADNLNDHSDELGASYDWRLVDDTNPSSIDPALDDAVGAVDAGYTVPVLIGDSYPHHYVLLVGHEGDQLVFYDPGGGEMTRVSESDFRSGNMSALGFDHVQGVITPS
jgi:hypothetical protein